MNVIKNILILFLFLFFLSGCNYRLSAEKKIQMQAVASKYNGKVLLSPKMNAFERWYSKGDFKYVRIEFRVGELSKEKFRDLIVDLEKCKEPYALRFYKDYNVDLESFDNFPDKIKYFGKCRVYYPRGRYESVKKAQDGKWWSDKVLFLTEKRK